jgi:hypothetical protein
MRKIALFMLTSSFFFVLSSSSSDKEEWDVVERKIRDTLREADSVLGTTRSMFAPSSSELRFKEDEKKNNVLDQEYRSEPVVGGKYILSDESFENVAAAAQIVERVEDLKASNDMRFKHTKQRALLYKPKMVEQSTISKLKNQALKKKSSEKECSPGTHIVNSPDGTQMCEVCDSGYYSSGTGEEKCSPCQGGTYTSSPRSSVCLDCPGGFQCRGEAVSKPQKCASDTFAVAGSEACSKCPLLFEVNEDGDDCRIDVFFYFVLAGLTLLFITCLVMCACSVLFSPGEENFKYYDKSQPPGAPFYGTI